MKIPRRLPSPATRPRPIGAAGLVAVLLLWAGPIRSATTVTSAVSTSLSSFCLLGVTSSAVTLTISTPSTAGSIPADATNANTYAQYSSTVSAGVTRRITAAWAVGNSAPGGCSLKLLATPGTGVGTSSGQITVSGTAQYIVTGVGGCATGTTATSGTRLAYTLSVTSMTSLVASASSTASITFTMTDS